VCFKQRLRLFINDNREVNMWHAELALTARRLTSDAPFTSELNTPQTQLTWEVCLRANVVATLYKIVCPLWGRVPEARSPTRLEVRLPPPIATTRPPPH
jgi:hypothetical protein